MFSLRLPLKAVAPAATRLLVLLLVASAVLVAGCSGTSGDAPRSSTRERVMSFTVMGDSGLGPPEFLQFPSSTNIPQLTRNVEDLASLDPKPAVSFMMGDLVMNFAGDQGQNLAGQLEAWQTVFGAIPGVGSLNFVPYLGNHESCEFNVPTSSQWPNPYSFPTWDAWAARNRYDRYAGNGPSPAGENLDLLVQDERNRSYSFTLGNVRFLVVNTDTLATPLDPATQKPYFGWIPLHWIESELAKAENDRTIEHVFVMGHRNLVSPSWTAGENELPVLDTPAWPLASSLSKAMKASSKVRAYMCGHIHCQDLARLENGTGTWQVITGSTGSPLDPDWKPAGGTYFGFRVVNIYSDGKVGLVDYTRPTPPPPQKYYQDVPVAPPAAEPGREFFLN